MNGGRRVNLEEMDQRLELWNDRIELLLNQLARFDPSDGIRHRQELVSLVQKRNTLTNKIEKLRQSLPSRWGGVEREVQQAWKELEEAWSCVRSRIGAKHRTYSQYTR